MIVVFGGGGALLNFFLCIVIQVDKTWYPALVSVIEQT